jgi:hypothetical protein
VCAQTRVNVRSRGQAPNRSVRSIGGQSHGATGGGCGRECADQEGTGDQPLTGGISGHGCARMKHGSDGDVRVRSFRAFVLSRFRERSSSPFVPARSLGRRACFFRSRHQLLEVSPRRGTGTSASLRSQSPFWRAVCPQWRRWAEAGVKKADRHLRFATEPVPVLAPLGAEEYSAVRWAVELCPLRGIRCMERSLRPDERFFLPCRSVGSVVQISGY